MSDKSSINKTRIIFNDRLKEFIYRTRKNHPDYLTSFSYDILLKDQEKLRKILLDNQIHINVNGRITSKPESMPDYFAFMCAYVSDLSQCNNWEDITNNLIKTHINSRTDYSLNYISFPEYPDDMDYNKKNVNCCCSQCCFPDSLTILSYPQTNLNLLIACVCIQKSKIINNIKLIEKLKPNKFKKEAIKRKEKNNYKKNFRQCEKCNLYKIDKNKNSNYKYCINCWDAIINPGIGRCLLTFNKK